ncbi:MAG: hypothetical protein M1830_005959 [Pleopsidium flavum]|nr:MAG: hypothetical protein M1830_005959 [Pleopsidium flavum]
MPTYNRVYYYCGWCKHGPFSCSLDEFCPNCQRLRDRTSIVDYGIVTGNSLLDGPAQAQAQLDLQDPLPEEYTEPPTQPRVPEGGHDEQNIEPVITPSESSTSPKKSSPDVNDRNSSRTGKHSLLEDYLCIKPEDAWNQELVAYAARTRLPGEFSFSVETGEPATTPRRRRYSPRRRAEVAHVRNNGGACEVHKRNRRACRHRLEGLEAIVDGHGATPEQVMARAGARRDATDRVAFDSEINDQVGNQHGEVAIDPGGPSATTSSASPQSRRRPAAQNRIHRRGRTRTSSNLSAARDERVLETYPSPANGGQHATGVRQPHFPVGPDAPLMLPAQRYEEQGSSTSISVHRDRQFNNSDTLSTRQNHTARRVTQALEPLHNTAIEFQGLFYANENNGFGLPPPISHHEQNIGVPESTAATSSTNLNTPLSQRSRPPLCSPSDEGECGYVNRTRSEVSTHTNPPVPKSQYFNYATPSRSADDPEGDASGILEPHWIPLQPSPIRQHLFEEQSNNDALLMGDSRDPPPYQLTRAPNHQRLPNVPEEYTTWGREDLSWVDGDPSDQVLDTSWIDQLPADPLEDDGRAPHRSTAVGEDPQLMGLYRTNDQDIYRGVACDLESYRGGHTNTGVHPSPGSYMAFLNDPDFTPRLESTIGSWSDVIPTPPSEDKVENNHE